jgi:quercetin dioxygenase-like cupin family protein
MRDFPEFIRRLPALDVALPGFGGHLLQGETHQVAFARCDADLEVPAHSHAAQWELVVAGEVVLRVAGEERTYRAGDSFYLPAGQEHSARLKAGFRSVIFFDQPDRYRAK